MSPNPAPSIQPARPKPAYGNAAGAVALGIGHDHNAAIREAAEKRLKAGVVNSATATKAELDRLGAEMALGMRCILLKAPVKGMDRAAIKVMEDYDGHWLDLKDVARITLVARDAEGMATVVDSIRKRFVPSNGFSMIKDTRTTPFIDPCGYSGHNFVVRFGMPPPNSNKVMQPSHPILAAEQKVIVEKMNALMNPRPAMPAFVGRFGEIQVNTVAMMYGKMSKRQFVEKIGAVDYFQCRAKFGVDGGAAHTLYEIWRSSASLPEKRRAAAALSKRYYQRLRFQDPKPWDPALNREVQPFCKGH